MTEVEFEIESYLAQIKIQGFNGNRKYLALASYMSAYQEFLL